MSKAAHDKMMSLVRIFTGTAAELKAQSDWLVPRQYAIRLRTDPPAHRIGASVSVRAEVTADHGGPLLALLGLPGMNVFQVRRVAIDGRPAAYRYRTPRLWVDLPRPAVAGTQLELAVDYEGRLSAPKGYTGPRCTELCFESLWAPMVAFPGVAFGVEAEITTPDTEETAFSGDPCGSRAAAGQRTTYWRTSHPLISATMLSGPFEVAERQAGELKVRILTQRGYGLAADGLAGMAGAIVRTGTEWFGELPLHQITIAQLHRREYGDYAHVPFVVFPRGHLSRKPTPEDMASVLESLAHELGHFWWGNVVTSDFIAEGWLSEGFADLTKHLAVERILGHQALVSLLRRMQAELDPLTDLPPLAEIKMGHPHQSKVVRRQGGLFLMALRQRLGDQVTQAALQKLYRRHAGGSIDTRAFCRAVQEKAQDPGLEGFLQQHLYGTPRYAVLDDGRITVAAG